MKTIQIDLTPRPNKEEPRISKMSDKVSEQSGGMSRYQQMLLQNPPSPRHSPRHSPMASRMSNGGMGSRGSISPRNMNDSRMTHKEDPDGSKTIG